ncbi:hypothetical protein KCU73_g63, partial [Aureobasidium melanogenum]
MRLKFCVSVRDQMPGTSSSFVSVFIDRLFLQDDSEIYEFRVQTCEFGQQCLSTFSKQIFSFQTGAKSEQSVHQPN